MKKILLPLAMILPLAAWAGEGQGPMHDRPDHGPGMEHHMKKLGERLDLTDQQKASLRDIFASHRERMKAAREETERQIDAILSAEQRARMQALREERAASWRERMKERREEHREERREEPRENDKSGEKQPAQAGR